MCQQFRMNKLLQTINERKISFAEVGRLVGYGRDTISRHCNGQRQISAEAALRYNKALGIPLHEMRPDIFEINETEDEKE
ncbi:protein of unknown function [Maridesulfovibrio hydrothermalis AM13 = DSM 14728]|uniref:HTH cro/C1-type domain-containing protein n=2 Tax=Maridesulfovibrio TaxID=2794998 RepID=L0REN7_9BACT|nr:protein of unknown function [Maridesulfovibrio hydrothermalis AM13 = DSM 14728]